MAYAYALDPATPPGGEAASLGDDRIREFKNAIIERVNSRFVSYDADPWIIKSPVAGGNTQSLIPTADNTYNLGSASLRFSDMQVMTATFSGLTTYGAALRIMNTDPRLRFNDTDGTVNKRVIDLQYASDRLDFHARDDAFLFVRSILTISHDGDAIIYPAKRFFLDGGGNTYIHESAPDVLAFVAGGITLLNVFGGGAPGAAVPSATRFYFDNGGDSYIHERAPNAIEIIVGGSRGIDLGGGLASIGSTLDLNIATGKRFYLDGASDTYIQEAAANQMFLVAGSSQTFIVTATHTLTQGNIVIRALDRIYLDGGADSYLHEASANSVNMIVGGSISMQFNPTNVVIESTDRFYFDGGGDTYLYESAANDLHVVAGGVLSANFTATFFAPRFDVILQATKKLYLDGGGDTYLVEEAANQPAMFSAASRIMTWYNDGPAVHGWKLFLDAHGDTYVWESAANVVNVVVGGTSAGLYASASGSAGTVLNFTLESTKRLYLDGGGDTSIFESAANIMRLQVGGVNQLSLDANQASVAGNLILASLGRLYLDGGGNTYAHEVGADIVEIVAGASTSMRFGTSYVWIPATNILYLDGGGDTYFQETGANIMRVVTGGVEAMRWDASQYTIIPATKRLYLDGGGDTYIHEQAANTLEIVVFGVSTFTSTGGTCTFPQGVVVIPGIPTTASAANVRVDTGVDDRLKRSTSSERYKDNVYPLEGAFALIMGARPVQFTSKSPGDDPHQIHVGLVAEEVFNLDKRFVDYFDGRPEGVNYDRFVAPLISVAQDHEHRIKALEDRLS